MSQTSLGVALKLTFQQVQKFELGRHRIGAGRLFELALILDVPVSFFFDDMSCEINESVASLYNNVCSPTLSSHVQQVGNDSLGSRETLQLVRSYYDIASPELRKRVIDLVRILAPADR